MEKETPEMRINDKDIFLIKSAFAENDELLKVVRKVFMPELDVTVPIGQQIDLYMTVKVEDMEPEQAIINIKARNMLIGHIEMCLGQLKALAGRKNETIAQTKERLKKDSSK